MPNAKILIVEDEAVIAWELERRLAALGYATAGPVATADAAVRSVGEHEPDIVLMDIHLRDGQDGIEVAAEIRSRFGIPVVFLTAYADDETISRACQSDPFGYLLKPYREEDLRLAIEVALIKHRAERELREANENLEQKVRERTEQLSRTVETLQKEIADHKETEKALRRSEERYGTILRTAMDGYLLSDRQGQLLEVNDAYCRMSGYDRRELLSMNISGLDAVETREEILFRITKIVLQGKDRFESRHRRKDGSLFDVEISTKFLSIENGRIVSFVRDISGHKRSRRILAETGRLLEAVFDHTHVMSAYLDPQFNFIRVNWAYAISENRDPSFYRGRNYFDLYHEKEAEATFRKVVSTGEPNIAYATAFHGDGNQERYLDWSLIPIKTADDTVEGLVLSMVDVTESVHARNELHRYRMRLEDIVTDRTAALEHTVEQLHAEITERTKLTAELHRSKLFLTNILNSIQDGICVLDRSRKIMLVNNAVARLIPEAEQIGFRTHTCGDLFHRLGRCDVCAVETAIHTGAVRTMTFSGGDETGRKWLEVHSFPLNSEDGKIIGCVEYIRDVTSAKIMAECITQYQERLRMLNYEMAVLQKREQRRIARELHDSIPQTLAFCRMRLESIEQRFAVAAPAVDQSEQFREICELLDRSITEARSLIFKLAPPVLYELGLEPALKQLMSQFTKSHQIAFNFKCKRAYAPVQGEGAAIVYGMVRELLTNCVKHSGADAVDIAVERVDGHLIVTVRDNGRGLADEGRAPSEEAPSGGFGLFSIRERLRHMDGDFTIEGVRDKGACATLRVPLLRLEAAAKQE